MANRSNTVSSFNARTVPVVKPMGIVRVVDEFTVRMIMNDFKLL